MSTELFKKQIFTNIVSPAIKLYSPTAIGVLTIPFIINPIDKIVDNLLDCTTRKIFHASNNDK